MIVLHSDLEILPEKIDPWMCRDCGQGYSAKPGRCAKCRSKRIVPTCHDKAIEARRKPEEIRRLLAPETADHFPIRCIEARITFNTLEEAVAWCHATRSAGSRRGLMDALYTGARYLACHWERRKTRAKGTGKRKRRRDRERSLE